MKGSFFVVIVHVFAVDYCAVMQCTKRGSVFAVLFYSLPPRMMHCSSLCHVFVAANHDTMTPPLDRSFQRYVGLDSVCFVIYYWSPAARPPPGHGLLAI